MPAAILDPNRNTIKSPLARSILNEISLNPVSTSILGPTLTRPDLVNQVRRLAQDIPGNVKEQATTRVKAMAHRFMEEAKSRGAQLSGMQRRDWMNRIASDPVANVFIQDDINVVPRMQGARGRYSPIFASERDVNPSVVDQIIAKANEGTDAVRDFLRKIRQDKWQGSSAIEIGENVARGEPEAVPGLLTHEATHGSQDRFGMLADRNLANYHLDEWADRPIEWEAKFAQEYLDPSQAKDAAEVIALGRNAAYKHSPPRLGRGIDDEVGMLRDINEMIRRGKSNARLVDLVAQPGSSFGRFGAVSGTEFIQNPKLKELMLAILGQ